MANSPTASDIERAVHAVWQRGWGTPLVSTVLTLQSVVEGGGGVLTIEVRSEEGPRAVFEVPVPDGQPAVDESSTPAGDLEEWAMWNVVVPIVEAFETREVESAARASTGVIRMRLR